MVLKFDLPEEISGVTVKQAKLSIYNSATNLGSIITAFRLTQDWIEDEVTWLNAANETEWETPWPAPIDPIANGDSIPPGGMSETEDSAATTCVELGQTGWEEFNVTSIIQKFSDGTGNFGFIIRANDVNGLTDRRYHSSEYEDDITLRPKLKIAYEDGSNPISEYSKKINMKSIQKVESNVDITFNLSLDGLYEITLFSLSGQKIETFSGSGNNSFTISKNKLKSACYLLSLKRDGRKSEVEKIWVIK